MRRKGNRLAGKVALAASATLLAVALPSSVFAIGMLSDSASADSGAGGISFTPASADPAMAALLAERSGSQAQMVRFTPAGAANARSDRSVTVAIRLDQQSAEALAAGDRRDGDGATPGLRVTPMRYNLGIARGYGSFAQAPARLAPSSATISSSLSNAGIPDLAEFAPSASTREEPSRFAARVQLDEGTRSVREGQARESINNQLLEVGGSFRLSRNLDITAGLRIEQDRDLVPLPDVEQQDSQAVYVGTQFRF